MSTDFYKKLPIFNFSKKIMQDHPKRKLRGIIFGNFGAMNMGDDAILAGELKELSKIPNLTTTVIVRFPNEIKKKYKFKVIQFYSFFKVVKELLRSDFVIVGGGGIICRSKRGIMDSFYQMYSLCLFFATPILLKKQIYALGIGVYENTNLPNLWLSLFFLRRVQLVTVRDFYSQRYLESKNVSSKLYRDNSFLMGLVFKEIVLKENFFKKNYDRRRKNIGIALTKLEDKYEEEKLVSEISRFIVKNYKKSTYWIYSCGYHFSYSNDERLGRAIYNKVKEIIGRDPRIFFVPTNWKADKFFSSFKLMDFMVTMRLHASIFAYRINVPFVGISYDIKCSSFLDSIGKNPLKVSKVTFKKLQNEFEKNIL